MIFFWMTYVIPVYERLMGADSVRNRALSTSEDYHKARVENASVGLDTEGKHVIDIMPLFSKLVSGKMVDNALDNVRTSTLSSIRTKVMQLGDGQVGKIIKFPKTQKKGGLYGEKLRFHLNLTFAVNNCIRHFYPIGRNVH